MTFVFHTLLNAWIFAMILAVYEFGFRKQLRDNELHVCAAILVYALILGIVIARFQAH